MSSFLVCDAKGDTDSSVPNHVSSFISHRNPASSPPVNVEETSQLLGILSLNNPQETSVESSEDNSMTLEHNSQENTEEISNSTTLIGTEHSFVYSDDWAEQFISSRGNEYFCEIDEEYLLDRFNLTGLNSEVQYYQYALDLITDVFDLDADDNLREQIEKSARHLYGLVHARYIVTTRGLAKMVSKNLSIHIISREIQN